MHSHSPEKWWVFRSVWATPKQYVCTITADRVHPGIVVAAWARALMRWTACHVSARYWKILPAWVIEQLNRQKEEKKWREMQMPYRVLLPHTALIKPSGVDSHRLPRLQLTHLFCCILLLLHILTIKQPGGSQIKLLISNFLLADEQNLPPIYRC